MVSRLLRAWFGDFSKEELKKFIKLGVTFGLIIGIYWTLRPLKDALFQSLVGPFYQPYAKMVSLVILFPLVIIYSRLVERLPRQQLFYLLSAIYGGATLVMAFLMTLPSIGLATDPSVYNILGWVWYVFVESFGSLVVALFWAFTTDITTPESGKRGFSLVVMIGQIGGILAPPLLTGLPKWYPGFISLPMVVGFTGLLMFIIIPLISYFMATTPPEELKGFNEREPEPVDAPADNTHQKEVEPGFLEGLRLMLAKPYLLGIFGIITFFEAIVTVFDYHFKIMARARLVSDEQVSALLGQYAFFANLVTFLCLLFGISNITRRLGVTVALSLMPVIVAVGVGVIYFNTTLGVLFWVMVAAKGINYALNGPAMKQLYVPVSDDARYKSQAWIETFGSRGSKAGGSGLNALHSNLLVRFNGPAWGNMKAVRSLLYTPGDLGSYWHIALTSYLFLGICGVWMVVAIYLGRTYQKAIDTKKLAA